MNIYLIKPTPEGDERITWDCYVGHVVAAWTPREARALCPHADEGFQVGESYWTTGGFWTEEKYAYCEPVGQVYHGEARLILSSFNAG